MNTDHLLGEVKGLELNNQPGDRTEMPETEIVRPLKTAGFCILGLGILVILCNFPLVDMTGWMLNRYLGIELNTFRILRLHTSFLLLGSFTAIPGFFLTRWHQYRQIVLLQIQAEIDDDRIPRILRWKPILVVTTLAGILLTLGYYAHLAFDFPLERLIYREDGIVETMTAVFFLSAASLLFIRSVRKTPDVSPSRGRFWSIVLYGLPAVVCFGIGMEEISWGQRLFNWHTPEFIAAVNYQHETNFHNLINPSWPIWYQAAGFVFVCLIGLGFYLHIARPHSRWVPLFPNPCLAGIATILILVTMVPSNEPMEELASVLAVSHALRLYYQ